MKLRNILPALFLLTLASQVWAGPVPPAATIPGIPGLANSLGSHWIVVSDGGNVADNVSNGTDTSTTSRRLYKAPYPLTALSGMYGNWKLVSFVDTPNANAVTVLAGLEATSSTFVGPNIPFGGVKSKVVDPGAIFYSDPRSTFITKGTSWGWRTNVQASGTWPTGAPSDTFTGDGDNSNAGDVSVSGTIASTANNAYVPMAILGQTSTVGAAAVFAVGDSKMSWDGVRKGREGWVWHWCDNFGCGHYLAAESGDLASNTANAANSWARDTVAQYCTSAFVDIGINDIKAGVAEATLKQNILNTQRRYYYLIPTHRVYAFTFLPCTTSTNAGIDVVHQSLLTGGKETVRTDINAWMRDGEPVDASDVPQAVGSSGAGITRWKYVVAVCDSGAAIGECDVNGTPMVDGGRWPAPTTISFTQASSGGAVTASATGNVTMGGAAYTTNALRGLRFAIITATTGPNQVGIIRTNTATVANYMASIATAPSTDATYEVDNGLTSNMTHLSPTGAVTMALNIKPVAGSPYSTIIP